MDYLNWLFSPESDPFMAAIDSSNNGVRSQCLIDEGYSPTYAKYRGISRIQAARRILRDVICQVNASGDVRFGFASFRVADDPAGGYVSVPVDDYTTSQGAALDAAISGLEGQTWTPLGVGVPPHR